MKNYHRICENCGKKCTDIQADIFESTETTGWGTQLECTECGEKFPELTFCPSKELGIKCTNKDCRVCSRKSMEKINE